MSKSQPDEVNAKRSVRVTEAVYLELVRRQVERLKRDGDRPSLADLVAEAVQGTK